MQTKLTTIVASFSISALFVAGCATVPPPNELLDARKAYQFAQGAPGVELTPVPLHNAKNALDDAERAFLDEPTSLNTRSLAYVADRKAQLSAADSGWARAGKQKEQAQRDLAAYQAQDLANTKQGLSNVQGELGRTKEQLAAEKVAREAADKRAHDALAKLALAASLAVKEEPRGTVILLPGNILFVSAKADLLPTAKAKLTAVAHALKESGDRKIIVEGHTDSQGTEASNMDLAARRAQSVRSFLVSQGVKAESISATGIGQGRPVADNTSPEGRADNRRVEIVVTTEEKR